MTNTSYKVVTKSGGEFFVPYNTADPNNWTRGETATFEIEFPTFHDDLVVSDSYTVGGVEAYDSITVESGGTLTILDGAILQTRAIDNNGTIDNNGSLINNGEDFAAKFNDYVDFAGKYATNDMLNGVTKYRTQIPSSASIASLAWGIEPNQSLQDDNIVGVWGLVDAIQNARNRMPTINRYQVDVLVLAEYSEYSDHSALETDLKI